MKLKINKACDLSSISVLPPPARRSNALLNVPESSVFGKSQGSQLRSQQSQQSFSQGISSQHGMYSQISQNSLDEIFTNDQRINTQDKENSAQKVACLPMVSHSREESQMAISRSSANPLTKWNSTTSADHKSLRSEELDHRIWSMETSLNRFAMILDSLQTDIMQVNKGTKEVVMEMEGIRQKLIANDNLLQQMGKGQEDIKSNLSEGFKSISDQVRQDLYQEKLKEISSAIADLKGQIDVRLQDLKPEICKSVSQQMQAIACSWKAPYQKHMSPAVASPKAIACSLKAPYQKHLSPTVVSQKEASARPYQKHLSPTVMSPKEISRRVNPKQMLYATPKQKPHPKKLSSVTAQAFRANPNHMVTRSQMRQEICQKAHLEPKVEVGSWTSVKAEQATITYRRRNNEYKQERPSPIKLDREWRIPIESDEEIDGGFSCLFEEKETGNYFTAEVKEETERILRKARRRKRKSRNVIILN